MSHPQYLLRFDDICPAMNWRVWAEIESVLVERRLNPMLAVVPDNRDPKLQVESPVGDFWDRVRAWQDRGWTIAMHGYQHLYVTRNAGLAARRRQSEFAGLPAETQREKLRRGSKIFEREGLTTRAWIAPGNTFDATTVALLPEFGIDVISVGYFRFPYATPVIPPDEKRFLRKDLDPSEMSDGDGWMAWVPQQLYYFRPAPAGVWTVCYHHNGWDSARLRKFHADLDDYGANIVSLDDVLARPPRECKRSAWLCTHPRVSEFLIRGELKLWGMTRGARRLMWEAEADLTSPIARRPSR